MPDSLTISRARYIIHQLTTNMWLALGAFLAAASIRVFLLPNQLIDGGIVGITLILGRLLGPSYLSYFLVALNLPFMYLAYKYIRKTFVLHMIIAVIFFALFLSILEHAPVFQGDPLEIIVIGGAVLGVGAGLIIRNGGCTDGTEILAILINRKKGFTVGQVILFINIFIFTAYGLIFKDWHIALQSLMTYFVAYKMMDLVIVGLDELKSCLIISKIPQELSKAIMHRLGLGLTIIHGQGGFSGVSKDILYVFVERLDLADLKELVLKEDPTAFMAIENLHEVVYGKRHGSTHFKRRKSKFFPYFPEDES
jgi:uncharacterized membrane-anchored protein YitT (DUF2179 family)